MKFWRIRLLTALSFFGFIAIFLTTSCEKNVCDNVTCFNGGSCNMGTCRCPVGWEGPQCNFKSVDRFTGVYGGLTRCNNGAFIIDTAWITPDPNIINFVYLTYKSILPRKLHGYVHNNASTYSIVIQSDSVLNYLKVYTVTLQNDKSLNIHTYEHNQLVVGDTSINECTFTGTKK
jgi:hypothetical protein